MIVAHYFIKIDEILATIWYFYLVILLIKAIATKSNLDRLKRNMIFIKCVIHLIFGYLGIILISIFKSILITSGYNNAIFMQVFVIVLSIIDIGILLFYSGTPFIIFQQKVSYSWPLNRMNSQ